MDCRWSQRPETLNKKVSRDDVSNVAFRGGDHRGEECHSGHVNGPAVTWSVAANSLKRR